MSVAVENAMLQKIADTVRVLSAEAIEKATCGHPGLPLGCAEIGAYLYTNFLRHNPSNPDWAGRDRFVLSAGHGSMFLYSLLHLSGYELSLEDLKNFRQLHSKTPGHPEVDEAPGVETTTGPLGQGITAAVGMAMANKFMGQRFGKELFDGKVVALAGDGCLMEGISHEAASLAGHYNLDNLIVIYDSNDICLDGPTSECFTDDTVKRFESYGFAVCTIDGHNFDEIAKALDTARAATQPVLIIAKTIIGKGAPNKQGTHKVHGAALGQDEIDAMKAALGWPSDAFHVPAEVYDAMKAVQEKGAAIEAEWNDKLANLGDDAAKLYNCFANQALPEDFDDQMWALDLPAGKATRALSQSCLNLAAKLVPWFVVGSADLSCSDSTALKEGGSVTPTDWSAQQFKFGVREFGMATACYGMRLGGMIQPLCGTFLTFSDYMRNAVRLSALMNQRCFYQFTHDSVLLGEDGPTHQPVEHVMSLRMIPNLTVIRPGDENETKAAWIQMFKSEAPVAFIGSRLGVNSAATAELTAAKAREGVAKGAYVLDGPESEVDVQIIATGSELGVAMEASKALQAEGKSVRVVSMPSWELFEAQDDAYKASIVAAPAKLRVSLEAGTTIGWHKYIGSDGLAIGVDQFGLSAPADVIADQLGLTAEKVTAKIKAAM